MSTVLKDLAKIDKAMHHQKRAAKKDAFENASFFDQRDGNTMRSHRDLTSFHETVWGKCDVMYPKHTYFPFC